MNAEGTTAANFPPVLSDKVPCISPTHRIVLLNLIPAPSENVDGSIMTGEPLKPPTLGLSRMKNSEGCPLSKRFSVSNPLDACDSFVIADIRASGPTVSTPSPSGKPIVVSGRFLSGASSKPTNIAGGRPRLPIIRAASDVGVMRNTATSAVGWKPHTGFALGDVMAVIGNVAALSPSPENVTSEVSFMVMAIWAAVTRN